MSKYNGILPVKHAMLQTNHHFVQLAQQRHQLADAQLLAIGTNRATGDAIITGILAGLSLKIHLERCGVLFFPFRRVPIDIPQNIFLIGCFSLACIQVDHGEIPFHMVQASSHHLLPVFQEHLFVVDLHIGQLIPPAVNLAPIRKEHAKS